MVAPCRRARGDGVAHARGRRVVRVDGGSSCAALEVHKGGWPRDGARLPPGRRSSRSRASCRRVGSTPSTAASLGPATPLGGEARLGPQLRADGAHPEAHGQQRDLVDCARAESARRVGGVVAFK